MEEWIAMKPDDNSRYYLSLIDLGYAEPAAQGHAMGYRLTPDGHKVAMERWGMSSHDPRCL